MTEKVIYTDNKTALAEHLLLILTAINTIVTIGWVLWLSRYGIDFTDESFYLVWMENPFNYPFSATQFGFIYHPLYLWLDGNIAYLRQVNLLVTFFLGWVLSYCFFKSIYGYERLDTIHGLVISSGIATSSLVLFHIWLPTPSYNSLAFQALLISATGMLLADKISTISSMVGWLLIGIGGWLAFMAKPTTAAALGLWLCIYLILAKKVNIRWLLISIFTAGALLFISALQIDGSLSGFIERVKGGVKIGTMLTNRSPNAANLLKLDRFDLTGTTKLLLFIGTALFFSAAYLWQSENKFKKYSGIVLTLIFFLTTLTLIFRFTDKFVSEGSFQALLLWAIPFATILISFSLFNHKDFLQVSRTNWACATSFLLFPHIYAFGTNNNYWVIASGAGIFWILAGLVFLSPVFPNTKLLTLLLPLCFAVQLVSALILQAAVELPYRQPEPLRQQNYAIAIGKSGSMLRLARSYGQYIKAATALAKQAQFTKGTPMIDLSGRSPGLLYSLGAKNSGQAWTLGGYSGSDKFVIEGLKKESCKELSLAWLLVEPEGPGGISAKILSIFGADITKDFETVGTLKTPKGAGGYNQPRIQQLLKPIRPTEEAITACNVARKE